MSSDAPPGLRLLGANLPRSCSIGPSIILRDAGRLTGSTTFRARRDRSFLEQSGSLASLTEGSQSPLRVRIQLPPPTSHCEPIPGIGPSLLASKISSSTAPTCLTPYLT